MGAAFDRLVTEKYLLLTTFRGNGDPVATPVWMAGLDGELVLWTDPDTGKLKRIRRNPLVRVQACDMRGRKTHGDPIEGTARVLDERARDRAHLAIARKYGVIGRLVYLLGKMRRRGHRTVSIAITPASTE